MFDDGGFFEEFNEDDVEDVELSASEEDSESIDDFKESTVYQEIDGVLNEVEEDEQSAGNDPDPVPKLVQQMQKQYRN